ncbi:hypothetical protein MNBD_GAMMA01-116 [hydrothermal vent metagenome]|uniref:Type IV fimbrial biogenesis protein PilV n=1 Tax=hydrothermal vent metagenome TaxID=652676 RepID=A0A3B0V751_9ZZZZ
MKLFFTKKTSNQQGFTLIESMIAVVVFSFGLLAVAGVMTVAVRGNHNGYMRTQATFLLASASDMMRANAIGVRQGLYNGAYSGAVDVSGMCTSGPCGVAGLVARDTQLWANMITQTLPNSEGTIDCTNHVGLPNAPYSGLCTVTINWTESNEIDAESTQAASIVVKPIL